MTRHIALLLSFFSSILLPRLNVVTKGAVALLLASGLWLGLALQPQRVLAQVAYQLLTSATEAPVVIDQWNQPRAANRIVLYTPKFGTRTQTNAFGAEVTLKPVVSAASQAGVAPLTHEFQVIAVTPETCALGSGDRALSCGNNLIPTDGVVLSANGRAVPSLSGLSIGSVVRILPQWFEHNSRTINVINPNLSNNGSACSFPGCRGSGQLIIYTHDFGAERTGTNEFGFEVTVENGRVVAQEGSDSAIPLNGYVMSGHGSSRDWLIQHAPIGAQMALSDDQSMITSSIDATTYQHQLASRLSLAQRHKVCAPNNFSFLGATALSNTLAESFTFHPPNLLGGPNKTVVSFSDDTLCKAAEKAIASPVLNQPVSVGDVTLNAPDSLSNQPAAVTSTNMDDAIDRLYTLRTHLDNAIWASHKPFPPQAPHAVWHRPVEQSRAEIGQTLDQWKKAGLNTVFLETFFHGYTLFPSKTMAAYTLPIRHPGYVTLNDPLQVWIEEAHGRGMQIHCWFETMYGGNRNVAPTDDAEVGPILGLYPQWANRTFGNKDDATPHPSTLESGAYFLDPANPEVQQFILALTQELASQYHIDGLQLDYIRYPSNAPKGSSRYLEASWGYTPIARENFKAATGFDINSFTLPGLLKAPAPVAPPAAALPSVKPVTNALNSLPKLSSVAAPVAAVVVPSQKGQWQQWSSFREDQVTALVGRVSDMVRTQVNPARAQRREPALVLSIAIFPRDDEARARKHQNWPEWVNQGLIDWVCPMTLTSSPKVIAADTRHLKNIAQGRAKVISGIFGPFNGNGPDQILQQLDVAREQQADGYSLFDSAHITGETLHALELGYRSSTQ